MQWVCNGTRLLVVVMMLSDLIEIGCYMDMMQHEKGNATERGIDEKTNRRRYKKQPKGSWGDVCKVKVPTTLCLAFVSSLVMMYCH